VTRQRLGIVSAGLLALAAPASGWGQCGHRVVGTLADDRLDPAVAGEVRHLLGGETLAMVSTWADEVRNDPRYHRGTWHYTSIPDGATWGDAPRSEEGEEDLVQAILLNARILADRARSRRDRGVALRWLAHLVGDLHQPLHTSARVSERDPEGDRGGNDFELHRPELAGAEWWRRDNLHRLWDSALTREHPRHFWESEWRYRERLVEVVEGASPTTSGAEPGGDLAYEAWGREGYELAKTVCYPPELVRDRRAPESVVERAAEVSAERIRLAGGRLARVLEAAL